MSKRTVIAFFILVLTALGISGCGPTCDPGSLISPDLVSPNLWEVVDGTNTVLEWSYADTCDPDDFEIILSQDRDFSTIEHTQLVSGTSLTWTAPALDIAEEYFWRVRAKVDSTYGPYSLSLRSFFTEPTCSAGDLVMPSLVSPIWGGIYDDDYDSLEWEWPLSTCIPESYRVEVSMDSNFIDTTYNGGTGNPSTRWGFGSTPPDATQFWWRISAYADGAYGPPSIASSFFTPPICSGASLIQAVPLTPSHGDTVLVGNPEFSWEYPDTSCIPEGYHLRIYQPWDWDYTVMEVDSPDAFSLSFQAGVPLPDCGDYYWQISMYSEGVEGPLNIGQRVIVDSGSCDCAFGSIPIPVLDRPLPYEIYPDTNVHSHWHAPGDCFPSGASYKISTDPDFADTSRDVMMSRRFPNAFDPPGLEPATQYWWKVAFFEEDGSGEPVLGDFSERQSFFTGPECGTIAEVGEPILIEPADGAVVDTTVPVMRYLPGASCLPDEYRINLHMVPDLSDLNLMGSVPLPATSVSPDTELENCEEYFWMVTAIKDGVDGPHSTISSFFVNEGGLCPSPGVGGTAKTNNFCREGTFEMFEANWTHNVGDKVLAIARNPFSTYMLFNILDQETGKPHEHEIHCWSYFDHFVFERSTDNLPVKNPPPTPTPVPQPVCNEKLGQEDCKISGGTYDPKKQFCYCP